MGVLSALERVIGRRGAPLEGLEPRVACFREVLHANNQALGAIASIQQALAGEREATARDVRTLVAAVTVQTFRMIANLNRLTGDRHRALLPRFEAIRARLSRAVEVAPCLREVGRVVPLADADADLAEAIGQKSAFLGAAARVLGGRVPAGFAIGAGAYHSFMAAGLGARLDALVAGLDPGDPRACFAVAAEANRMIEAEPLPADLVAEIAAAVRSLCTSGGELRLAVRSSAVQEGGLDASFAGQYRSLLNVRPESVPDAYRQVVASKYSAQALAYRIARGFDDGEIAMCACVLAMVPAASAGVIYSDCRGAGGESAALVQAVRGLGLTAVDGSVEPESVLVDRRTGRVIERHGGRQEFELRGAFDEGTERVPVAPGGAVVSDERAAELASVAWRLQEALSSAVDVEWAIDADGRVWVLQVRPQPAHSQAFTAWRQPRPGATVIHVGGSRASGGVASGPVWRVVSDLDLLRCPPGAVVVAREASPRLAVLLPRAAALVTDFGEVTSHLATVARELGIPAIVAAAGATGRLASNTVVTVDADAVAVYAGRIPDLLEQRRAVAGRNPHRERLASVADDIVPLTLRDRLASGYSARRCQTLHDIIRFCHQATIEAMFALGDRALRASGTVRRLVTAVPIDCRLIDLGGGVRDGAGNEVGLEDITSRPMIALWRGMTDPRLRWRLTRAVSVSGFMSALVNYNFDADSRVRAMGEPSYAFVSADYLSLNSRVGYHFSTVDARVTGKLESNYASFRFVGGSTGVEQRSRRAQLIERVLTASGFETDCRADLVNARLRHVPAEEIERCLTLLGLLTGFVNHLDMVLVSDDELERYAAAFLEGRYSFRGEPADA